MDSENKFIDIADEIYQDTFDKTYDALVEEYKAGEVDFETLERTLSEQQEVLMNGLYAGETRFSHTNAIVDAYQFVITMIRRGKIKKD